MGTLYHATVPLFIRDEQGRFSTSFECELIPRETYYALNIEMPDGDDEAIWSALCHGRVRRA